MSRTVSRAALTLLLIALLGSVAWAQVCPPGNLPACPIAPDTQTRGLWEPVICWGAPYAAFNTILLKTGKVLFITNQGDPWLIDAVDPLTIITPNGSPPGILDCSGHAGLPDGRVVFVGGGGGYDSAHDKTIIFDPDPEILTWEEQDPMPTGKRWYPTCTTRADGTILILGGVDNLDLQNTNIPLIFNAHPTDPEIHVAAPPHGFAAPPGYYMLFILDDGVPSIAEMVKVAPAP